MTYREYCIAEGMEKAWKRHGKGMEKDEWKGLKKEELKLLKMH